MNPPPERPGGGPGGGPGGVPSHIPGHGPEVPGHGAGHSATDLPSRAGPVWPWVLDVAPAVPELGTDAWTELARFEIALRSALATVPQPRATVPDPDQDPTGRVGRRLLALRRALAPGSVLGPWGLARADLDTELGDEVRRSGALVQVVRQFIAGYQDVDLRDVTGPGHGHMILRHGAGEVVERWASRLDAGDLVGTAMTEGAGGSRLRASATGLVPDGAGRWRLVGAKCWISRLHEAAAFVVSAVDVGGHTVAVLVEGTRDGLVRTPQEPAGLGGWSWGSLELDHVAIRDIDLLTHRPVAPGGPFARHFALYRLLVTATALGAAAGVVDLVARLLAERRAREEIVRVGDHALIALATADSDVRAAWLSTLHTTRDAVLGGPGAVARAAATKAHGVETARRVADALAPLAGAAGFVRAHPLAKARADLEALRFADGAHDSLRRHAGARLLPPTT